MNYLAKPNRVVFILYDCRFYGIVRGLDLEIDKTERGGGTQ